MRSVKGFDESEGFGVVALVIVDLGELRREDGVAGVSGERRDEGLLGGWLTLLLRSRSCARAAVAAGSFGEEARKRR